MEKYHGNTVEYWKQNAEENYLTTPISVLKYITVLEEQAEQLRKHDVISCVCPNEIKTGTVSIDCCNLCGKPDEDWWGKH